ncbi:right-handed parallel beta-helix repeat-containing protein [Paludisphaera mucosa]|uniref:Right-handed parallel beta-helix repeat-containing protein n=1 Tax=Paludisphaera mucosa TaxID=3030827 RepID=A0ABT6F5F0_9BACT|nr:right-handed parallel beta-helix repeat-containing protein [Paludisphaera mucosa]MDG3002744.1 right-handed parallel beta-helix repeat-containing protein [Paludisphaera mucosa]
MRTSFRTLLAAVAITSATLSLAAAPTSTRTWHVAPEPLRGLPPDVQLRTISEAAAKVEPGDRVVIHGGVYRESVTVEASGTVERPIRFEAAPGEAVVVSGADVIREWTREPGGRDVFSAPWPHRFIAWDPSGTHPGDDYHRMIGRCEQVFIGGYPHLQTLGREGLGRGTFYVDPEAKRLYVCPRDDTDLTKSPPLVEASSRQELWRSKGAYTHLRGVRFRYAANMAQHGAAIFEGDQGLVEDCIFEAMNSSGATFAAPNLTVRRCAFRGNGQLGFGAAGAHNLLFTECEVSGNNVKGFNRGWEAGGDKLTLCRGAVLEKSRFVANRGCGVWFDIGNEQSVVRNCLIADNEDAGVFYEISYGLHAHDNVIVGNGFRDTPGAWGAGAGIALSSSPGCLIERNLIVGNREGFSFREQGRTTPTIDDPAERPVWNHDERIRRNVLALNRDAQVRGWFDQDDGRHWPAALQQPGEKAKGGPSGPSLETLKIAFEGNFYDARPWQPLFVWGVDWKRHIAFASLEDVRSALGFEREGRAGEFRVADLLARDFRTPADGPAREMGCYPQGDVPGVRLGILPAR